MDIQTPYLDTINAPQDLRKYQPKDLEKIAKELRQATIKAVSKTGGHLGASLGVVELTVALHYVYDTPKDLLIWDVSHQSYPHKILTGRKDKINTLRQRGGLSGFTRRVESPYDPFGAAHAGTSISAGLGMASAKNLDNADDNIICVIGDGAMSAGMAYEGLNNAGQNNKRFIVILNDNDMSIAPPTGAMSAYLARLVSSKSYFKVLHWANRIMQHLPDYMQKQARRLEGLLRTSPHTEGTLFEQLGFHYVGPIDGHNINHLIPVLQNIKKVTKKPILVHVITQKGKGYKPAEKAEDKYHGVARFDIVTGKQKKPTTKPAPSYTEIFAKALVEEAKHDDKIVAITAAMPSGTGLDIFANSFPKRCFDVGIAEQHAVTFAAGLATQNYKPFVAIYSTFLQRAYDQIVHDVALQKLPVRFAIDRAGLVGADGPTHAGAFDTTFLATLPDFVVMAAADEAELTNMVATALAINDRPCSFRYPRGAGPNITPPKRGTPLPLGKGRVVRVGSGDDLAILSFGARLTQALKAADYLTKYNIYATVADARFAKPLDEELLTQLGESHKAILTLEEGSVGGFGSHVLEFYANHGMLDKGLKIRTLALPDTFIDHGTPQDMYEEAKLTHPWIVKKALQLLQKEERFISAV